jgi:hypothetical protein
MVVYEGLAKFDKLNFNSPLKKKMLLVEIDFVEVLRTKVLFFQFHLEFTIHLQ